MISAMIVVVLVVVCAAAPGSIELQLFRAQQRTSIFKKLNFTVLGAKTRPRLHSEDIEYLIAATNYKPEEIKARHKRFLKSHPSGKISKKSFHKLLSSCFDNSKQANISKHLWRMYDVNSDGVIDFSEFLIANNVMSVGSLEQNLERIFRFYDVNSNGFIERSELIEVIHDLFDCDNSDKNRIINEAFKEINNENLEQISKDEFIQSCLQNRKFSTLLSMKVVSLFLDT